MINTLILGSDSYSENGCNSIIYLLRYITITHQLRVRVLQLPLRHCESHNYDTDIETELYKNLYYSIIISQSKKIVLVSRLWTVLVQMWCQSKVLNNVELY